MAQLSTLLLYPKLYQQNKATVWTWTTSIKRLLFLSYLLFIYLSINYTHTLISTGKIIKFIKFRNYNINMVKLKKRTYYFTKNKIKGIDGKKLYFVNNKEDIKYLGGLNTKYTSFTKPQFKKFMKEVYNEDIKIINV